MNLEFGSKDIITFKEVEDLWLKNSNQTVIYFHNPFCVTQNNCNYCMHKGCPKKNHTQEEVNKYYFDYALKMFKKYENIIKSQDIKMINFGGGTPNYLSSSDFDKFCSMLPDWFKQKEKIIELHPALITKEYIDVLEKWNFKNLIFCFQTFDKETLKKQGRLTESNIDVYKYAKSKKFNLAVDLITCWEYNKHDYEILDNDLRILKELQPDEITISALYQNKYGRSQEEIANIYLEMKKVVVKNIPYYENPEGTLDAFFNVCATRFFKKDSDIKRVFDIYINSISDFAWEHNQGYSTLGIGTYKNGDKATYSIIGPDYLIYEEFNGFDNEPIFHLAKNWNFWEADKNVISALEEKLGKNPPVGFHLVLDNIIQSLSLGDLGDGIYTQLNHFVQGNCKWNVSSRLPYCQTDEEKEFIKEINNIDKDFIYSYNCNTKGEKNE